MAKEGYDLQMDEVRKPLLPKTTVTTTETSFINSTFEDDSKDNYNTPETSHSSSDPNFKDTVPFSDEGTELGGATAEGAPHNKMFYVTSKEGYTDVTKEELTLAIISARKGENIKGWKTTKEGIENMVNYVDKKDGNFYLLLEGADYKIRGYKLTYKEVKNNIVKFYAKSILARDYGKDIAELVELLLTDPEELSLACAAMSFGITDQISQKDEEDSRQRKKWEETKYGPHDESTRDDQQIPMQIRKIKLSK